MQYIVELWQKGGCSECESRRQTRLPCRCYPITVPGRFFSLLCCQSRASESFQSPRPLSLRREAYGYPKLDTGTRQTGNLSKSSTPHHLHTTTKPVYRIYPGTTQHTWMLKQRIGPPPFSYGSSLPLQSPTPLIALMMRAQVGDSERKDDHARELACCILARGWAKFCIRSCSALWTINFPMQEPFIFPLRSGCAFSRVGCFIIIAGVSFLFSFYQSPRVRELEVSKKLSSVPMEISSGFFLADEAERSMLLRSLLTRLSPGRGSLKLEELVL